MRNLKIIDVSLRDGGYQNQFCFKEDELCDIVQSLDQVSVDYIEIGYRNGSIRSIPSIGSGGLSDRKYILKCAKLMRNSKIALMLHPGNVNDDDLKELVDLGVDLCRVCVMKGKLENAESVIERAIRYGLKVSANITRVTQYTGPELDMLINRLLRYDLSALYFADSNGSLTPEKIHQSFKKYSDVSDVPFGFHAHDNLGLAQTNSIEAIRAGFQFIDVSLSGLGKGIGNLRSELFLSYLVAMGAKKYELKHLVKGANLASQIQRQYRIREEDLLMGIHDLSIDDVKVQFSRERV